MAIAPEELTTREKELQALAWQCFDSEPKVNYQKLATLAGMSNPVSASNAWAKIKKKMATQAGNAGNANGTNGTTDGSKSPEKGKKTPASKRKKKADVNGEGGGEEEESPTKSAKATPKRGGGGGRKKKAAEVEEDAVDSVDGVKVKGEDFDEEDVF